MDFEENDAQSGQQTQPRQIAIEPPSFLYTYLMVGAIVAVYVIQMSTGDSRTKGVYFDKTHFLNGEYWRIFTAAVLHGSLMHIFFNGYALYSFGRLTEILSNQAHLAIVMVLSILGGGTLSLLLNPGVPSLGASGGVIGLLGYIAVYAVKRKRFLNPQFRRDIFINIGLIALMGIALYNLIDNWAHLGGILTGAAYGLVQIPSDPEKDPRDINAFTDGVGFVCLGIFLATAFFTALYLLDII